MDNKITDIMKKMEMPKLPEKKTWTKVGKITGLVPLLIAWLMMWWFAMDAIIKKDYEATTAYFFALFVFLGAIISCFWIRNTCTKNDKTDKICRWFFYFLWLLSHLVTFIATIIIISKKEMTVFTIISICFMVYFGLIVIVLLGGWIYRRKTLPEKKTWTKMGKIIGLALLFVLWTMMWTFAMVAFIKNDFEAITACFFALFIFLGALTSCSWICKTCTKNDKTDKICQWFFKLLWLSSHLVTFIATIIIISKKEMTVFTQISICFMVYLGLIVIVLLGGWSYRRKTLKRNNTNENEHNNFEKSEVEKPLM